MTTLTTKQAPGFLCALEELTDGEPGLRRAGTVELILLRRGAAVKAWHNICPHQGRALNWAPDRFLRDEQGRLVCAAHGAVFELERGACVSGPCLGAALSPVDVQVVDGDVFLP